MACQGHCYVFYPELTYSWINSRAQCGTHNVDLNLVAIETEEEQNWIKQQGLALPGEKWKINHTGDFTTSVFVFH